MGTAAQRTSVELWLRDYVYYPLSREMRRRVAKPGHLAKLALPPLTTMLVSGLWHGFSAHMLVWGGLHGLFLIAEQLLRRGRGVVSPDGWPLWRQTLGMLTVAIFVTLAWVSFRLELPAALEFWNALASWTGAGIHHRRLFIALAIVALSLGADWIQYRRQTELVFMQWPRVTQAGLLGLALFALWIVAPVESPEPFVYQGF